MNRIADVHIRFEIADEEWLDELSVESFVEFLNETFENTSEYQRGGWHLLESDCQILTPVLSRRAGGKAGISDADRDADPSNRP